MPKRPLPPSPGRDCMAPDTEPTDAELAEVMREAAELTRERKRQGEAWLASQIELALAAALQRAVRS